MIHCTELNKDFECKESLIKELKKNAHDIIARKKAVIQKSIDKGISISRSLIDLSKIEIADKALNFETDKYYYIAVNTTGILDSHKDLHLSGIWNKTIKEQQGKNYLVADHALELDKTIVKKEYVELKLMGIPFSLIGKNYEGETQALVYKVPKDKVINQTAKEWLESGDSIEASVRMQYVDIVFAANSDDPENKTEKANYDKYIAQIANKDDFSDEIMYFWAVKQAKNIMESSLVLFGSNSATGQITIDNAKSQPSDDTEQDDNEPSDDTHETYKYLIENLKK